MPNNQNGYVGFYNGKRGEVYANSTYEAQKKLAEILGAKLIYKVSVTLAEKDGKQVKHTPDF
jgi:hypothetical protein